MRAIFNAIKGQPYDEVFIGGFLKEQFAQGVASLKQDDPAMMKRFFLQHVALETFYHLGKGAELSQLIPFVNSDSFHVQVSACRAVSRIDSTASRELLMKFIEGNGSSFAKVICVWGLRRLKAREMITRLNAFLNKGVDQEAGFGGSIMDPRVGTNFPDSVKDSIEQLLSEWEKPAPKKVFHRTAGHAAPYSRA